MKAILVTTDFSANSKRAIRFALQLSTQNQYKLVFYNVANTTKNASVWDTLSSNISDNIIMSQNQQKLEKFVEKIIQEGKFPKVEHQYVCEIVHVIGMNVANLVIEYANKNNIEYICTTSHGLGTLAKLFGSTASDLILKSPIPVFIIPKAYKTSTFKEICYASDFENVNTELQKINDFAKSIPSKINVLHFNYDSYLKMNKDKLLEITKKYESNEISFQIKKLNPKFTLNYHIRKDVSLLKPSLVVFFTKTNRNWFDRLFAQNNSSSMSFNTKVPLLIMRKTN